MRPSRSTKATTANPMQSTAAFNSGSQAGTHYPQVPSIRLISATPSATGISPDSSASFNQTLEESWATMSSQLPVPIAPKADEQSRKKLVPKKSKLNILGMGRDKEKDRGKDLSDVVRRVGAGNTASTRGGFEIYVDPTVDPEIGEIVMVKKKKSRVALDGMSWGALGEVTNVPKITPPVPPNKLKEDSGLLKVKVDEEKKWWSIGRGRKDSKEKNKENKGSINTQPVEFIYKPEPRSKTPEPFKSSQESRGRFNSLDSGLLLGKSKDASVRSVNPRPSTPAVQVSEPEQETKQSSIRERARSTTPAASMFGRSMTPTMGGLLAPPSAATTPTEDKGGSIAVRAIKSMRSLARMGSWAQLKNMPPPTAQEMAEEMARAESEGDKPKEKKEKKKAGSIKEKKKKEKVDENGVSVKKKSTKKAKEKSQTLRVSTSSFEAGHLSASPEAPKPIVTKKHSILGLGLPASMRLPTMRGGSTASSINFNLLGSSAQANPGAAPSASISISPNVAVANLAPQANRLSVESAIPQGRDRSASVASSNGSSLRPVSVASSNSRLSSGSSVVSGVSGASSGSSVRWDEEGLETVREQRKKDREARRMSEDSEVGTRRTSRESTRRSSEGRKRMPLSGVFEEVHHHQVGTAMLKDLTEVTEEESRAVEGEVEVEESFKFRNIKRLSAESGESARTTSTSSSMRRRRPILTIEEATADGHAFVDEDLDEEDSGCDEESLEKGHDKETPIKKARQRPLSEQMLGKARPKPMHEDHDEGVHSILSAATHDLALLLTTLDLQATPGTPDMTPFKPSPMSTVEKDNTETVSATPSSHDGSPQSKSTKARVALGMDSPLKKTLRGQVSSIASLRPYAQSRKNTTSPPSKLAPAPPTSSLASSTATIKAKNSTIGKSTAELISQQIAPWPVLMQAVSPAKSKLSSSPASISRATPPAANQTFKPGHKRTMTPAPEPEPEPVFQPLKPSRSRAPTVSDGTALANGMATIRPVKSKIGLAIDVFNKGGKAEEEKFDSSLFSARTFGPKSATLSKGSKGSMTLDELTTTSSNNPTPVFKRVREIEGLQSNSLRPANDRSAKGSNNSLLSINSSRRAPIARETRKILGMSGTLGGSDVSMYDGPEPDSDDPDSDVPDELRFLLATHSNRTSIAESIVFQDDVLSASARPISMDMLAPPPAISLPPSIPPPPVPTSKPPTLDLPIFRASLLDDDQNQLEIDCGASIASDEDTKKSFDFTGEIRLLNESGASDRASFVEQLEKAFKTPAKVDLRYDFDTHLRVEVPPVPALPVDLRMAMAVDHPDSSASTSSAFDSLANSQSQLVDVRQPSLMEKVEKSQLGQSRSISKIDMFSASRIVDTKQPTLLDGSDSESSGVEDISMASFQEDKASSVELGRSTRSDTSDGELNRSFRFGGVPRFEPATSSSDDAQPLTLSDIIPSPQQARAISELSMMSDDLEDDSVLKSIYAKLLGNKNPAAPDAGSLPDLPTHSNTAMRQVETSDNNRRSVYRESSRPTSGISFAGLESFDEVRRGFEFSGDRSFYPPPQARNGRRVPHRRDESLFSIASVSSYGHVLNNGVSDPFDYGLPSLRERPSSEDISSISMSMTVDDTFEFMHNRPRLRVDSDASSFYFQAPALAARGHRRRESNMSVTSLAPPISLYNRSLVHHRRNDSAASINSASVSYSRYGGGSQPWARHQRDQSIDSVMSDFSVRQFDRPGLGDKMFDNAVGHGPLTSISASPPDNTGVSDSHFANRNSYDSIMDEDPRSMVEDSIFEKTGQRNSVSSDYVFGDDGSHSFQAGLLPPHQFRPLSSFSIGSVHSPMLGGGHARRRSIGSIIEASPCVRVEKRKHSAIQQETKTYMNVERYESPNKARIVEKPSIASTSSFQFGGERMIRAQHGLLERQSLEDSCLSAEGEDISGYCVPLFSRPAVSSRSRSSTCTSSSGGDTPPLSASDGSSVSEGSQSSIDLSQLNVALSNATHPMSTIARNRTRARARGAGHRRRYSKAHMSRSSVYETIEEEVAAVPSPAQSLGTHKDDPTTRQGVFIVDSDTLSIDTTGEETVWDEERGIVALRKFYALRDEVETTVSESRKIWLDTPFSLYAVQSFQPPHHPAGMQALLEHSVQSYGPLPSELRLGRIRSRTSSRPSPYPSSRVSKTTTSPCTTQANSFELKPAPVLRQLNLDSNSSAVPSLGALKSLSPFTLDVITPQDTEVKSDKSFGAPQFIRPRVASNDRRTALGWSKRSTGAKGSVGKKENVTSGKENAPVTSTIMTPGDTLRLNRPRPKGRTPGGRTPASQNRSIRV